MGGAANVSMCILFFSLPWRLPDPNLTSPTCILALFLKNEDEC